MDVVAPAAVAIDVASHLPPSAGDRDVENGDTLPADDGVRYCFYLKQSQVKVIGRTAGSVLLIVGIAGLIFGVLFSNHTLTASSIANMVGGCIVIYFSESMQDLDVFVQELRKQRLTLANQTKQLEAQARERAVQEETLRKEIADLERVGNAATGAIHENIEEVEQMSARLRTTAIQTRQAIAAGVESGMARMDSAITVYQAGSNGFLAMSRLVAELRAENTKLKAGGRKELKE